MKLEQLNFKTLLVRESVEGVLICTFNRPEVRNALNLEMINELRTLLQQIKTSNIKVLLFNSSHEKVFISGADIKELRDRNRYDALQKINAGLFREIEQLPIPTIAVIEGFALGGGCELALACDLRVGGESAILGQPEVSLGIIPGGGATYRLPKIVGLGRAKDIIYTGRMIKAKEAFEIGLLNSLTTSGKALEEAQKLAVNIAKNSSFAVSLSKQLINQTPEMSTESAMLLESSLQALLFEDQEKYNRMTAFLERKKK